ncbi:hypothetical protein FNB79_10665 [Formosa sediminum]|uniref:Uncharacterized protein n=1 Tax=Formosa sediminum TaxID=2594004 RepID=A0A516GSB3_9FLAO|nr:hypothetical protein [Formosa sediminum]QDO94403.1 hypothetical protein FNB79_10665 [Formosa sediminum]
MTLIYSNNYGGCYNVSSAPNSKKVLQLVIDTVGIFMTKEDLSSLLTVILQEPAPCTCNNCSGERCNKIWCSNPLLDICLKVDKQKIELLEDLIRGTLFILEIDKTLDEYRLN